MTLFWSSKQIAHFQDFKNESLTQNLFRLTIFFLLAVSTIYEIYLDGWSRMAFNTMYHLVLCCISLALLIVKKKRNSTEQAKEWTLLLFGVAWANQVFITLIYWWKLYPIHVVHPKFPKTQLYWWHNFNKHFTPLFAFSVIFLTSRRIRFELNKSVSLFYFFTAIFNCILNAYGQRVRGEPIYYFTDWEKNPLKAFLIINGVAFGNAVVFYIFGEISQRWHCRGEKKVE